MNETMQWHNVDEDLPTDGRKVLVRIPKNGFVLHYLAHWVGSGWVVLDAAGASYQHLTLGERWATPAHWSYIPPLQDDPQPPPVAQFARALGYYWIRYTRGPSAGQVEIAHRELNWWFFARETSRSDRELRDAGIEVLEQVKPRSGA